MGERARVSPRLAVPDPSWDRDADVVVVGSGAAGLACALTAAAGGRRVLLVTKGGLGDGATRCAQGGLAAVQDPIDSIAAHVTDTLRAGAGLCDEAAVRDLAAAAPAAIASLSALGARFDTTGDGRLALTREGGHGTARVVHAGGDASGAEVSRTLLAALGRSNVEVLTEAVACDALRDEDGIVVGVSVARTGPGGAIDSVGELRSRALVLATGGMGHAYATTTNPAAATGDGLALALRAGALVRDMEFVQFHPTALWAGPGVHGQLTLVTEALRGDGAVLVDATGRRVMLGVHPAADLAPRDVVTTAMMRRMAQDGESDHLWLDATAIGRRVLERGFPTVFAACRARGVDPVTEPIPVVPAAHYLCGGVQADLDGVTNVPGLLVVGEAAGTGVHGANRLASNSVPEALVTGRRAGLRVTRSLPDGGRSPMRRLVGRRIAAGARADTATLTSRYAGILRDPAGVAVLLGHLAAVHASGEPAADLATIEATNLHTVSTLVALAAAARRESRGCHRRTDVAGPRPEWSAHLRWQLGDDGLIRARAPVRAAA